MRKILPILIVFSLILTPLLLPTSFVYAARGDFAFVGGIIIIGAKPLYVINHIVGPSVIIIKPTSPDLIGIWAVAGLKGFPCPGNFVLGYGYQTSEMGINFGIFIIGLAYGFNPFC